jgi:hypothetical protein
MKIRGGVVEDRRVSVEDPEMRHGRKSKTKRFNGYKRHIATDLASGLILRARSLRRTGRRRRPRRAWPRTFGARASRSTSSSSTAAT